MGLFRVFQLGYDEVESLKAALDLFVKQPNVDQNMKAEAEACLYGIRQEYDIDFPDHATQQNIMHEVIGDLRMCRANLCDISETEFADEVEALLIKAETIQQQRKDDPEWTGPLRMKVVSLDAHRDLFSIRRELEEK